MNVSKQIEEIIMDNVILGVDSGQAYFRDADQAVEKITTLLQTICLTVIGEDEVFSKAAKKYLTRKERTIVTRNVIRAEQRQNLTRLLKGEDYETN